MRILKLPLIFVSLLALCAVAVLEADSTKSASALQQGVELKVQTQQGEDLRVSRRIALSVAQGESPSSMLAAGQYTATWQGLLKIEKRSRVYFSFDGQGGAELFVDGKSVLKESATFGESESKRLRLNPGLVPIKLVYTSPNSGEGRVRLMWRGRKFSKEPVPASALYHTPDAKLNEATLVRRGRALFAEHKCAQCHAAGEGMPELAEMAPSLAGVGARLEAEWMAQWLSNPAQMRAHARMPKLLANEQEAADVAAYLAGLQGDEMISGTAGNVEAGAKTFHSLGCIACHRTDEKQDLAAWKRKPIDLFHVGEKFKAGALAAFLKKPGKHHASTRMPDFGLNDKEAADLSAFLRGLSQSQDKEVHAGDPVKGKELAVRNHCAQCHEGTEQSQSDYIPLASLTESSNSSLSCLNPEKKNGVRYTFSEADLAAINAFMHDERAKKSLVCFNKAEYSQRAFVNLNCAACHKMDGQLAELSQVHPLSAHAGGGEQGLGGLHPPELTYVGEKLRTDWLEKLFVGSLQSKSRPWLKQRMPAFPSRAKLLAEGFAAEYGVVDEVLKVAPAEKLGKTLYGSDGGFGCNACHGAAELDPTAVFEAPGVNLQIAGERLRADYYHRWMRDPRRIDPATIMPKYFIGENETTLSAPLDGDGHAQMESLWLWMQQLSKESK